MSVVIEGGCQICGMFTYSELSELSNSKEQYDANNGELTCRSCYQKYYSEEAIRDAKLAKLLKRSIWSKIRYFFIG
jgi:hypothetical protein